MKNISLFEITEKKKRIKIYLFKYLTVTMCLLKKDNVIYLRLEIKPSGLCSRIQDVEGF